MAGANLQRAYVLHLKPYTDSKKLVRLFSYDEGCLDAVARPSKRWPALEPFIPFLCHVSGKTQGLKNLRAAEIQDSTPRLQGHALFCALYLNELLARALPVGQAVQSIFEAYEETIKKLEGSHADAALLQVLLRRFEFSLLRELGFAVELLSCANGSKVINSCTAFYTFRLGFGFIPCALHEQNSTNPTLFHGEVLHAIAEQQWSSRSLSAAKRLSRLALPMLIGSEPLKARELFV
ncbi:DNA repair protein RecO [Agaribacterium sp. ZY112]|uniref:DNA repair protein RecO n=1 Tax=Agaribacterium sp. ZY112 TaxID=3233574 RepID=UPI003525E059